MRNDRTNYQHRHILAHNCTAETDTWKTGVNNNILIFGPSGSGKTRHYVKPNIMTSHESMIISDTKGTLYEELGPLLRQHGFTVHNINFTALSGSDGYNPLNYIRCDGYWNEQDILTLSHCLIEDWHSNDPYWCHAARQYLACMISYVLETMSPEKRTLKEVMRLLSVMDGEKFPALIEESSLLYPRSTTALRYRAFRGIAKAEKMDASIRGIISTNLDPLCFDQACALYCRDRQIDFAELGRKKCAVFLTISDTDRSMDKLANIFMTQALQILMRSADHDYPEHRLPIPVRFYLDDFASNMYIPDFDKIISVVRSREISISVILQSLTQLNSLYGKDRAATILNNCDRQLYLGGQDLDTAEYISHRANKPMEQILAMPVDHAWLFTRGQKPVMTEKYDISSLEAELYASPSDAEPDEELSMSV